MDGKTISHTAQGLSVARREGRSGGGTLTFEEGLLALVLGWVVKLRGFDHKLGC